MNSVEARFEVAKDMLLKLIHDKGPAVEGASAHLARTDNASSGSNIKLQPVKLVPFNGTDNTWIAFRDVFTAAVHENPDFAGKDVLKLMHLRSQMQGEAAIFMNAYGNMANDYTSVWSALNRRYNNKRAIMNHHLTALFDLPKMQSKDDVNLRQVYDRVAEASWALKSIGLPTEHWDALFVFLIVSRMDNDTIEFWENELKDDDGIPTLEQARKFVEGRARAFKSHERNLKQVRGQAQTKAEKPKPVWSTVLAGTASKGFCCGICNGNHRVVECTKFIGSSIEQRRQIVRDKRLCFICLKSGHTANKCRAVKCTKCHKRRHTTLHFNETPASTSLLSQQRSQSIGVLLATASVMIIEDQQPRGMVRALLDSGSMSSVITEDCVQRLRLQRKAASVIINGLGEKSAGRSRLPTITGNVPTVEVNDSKKFLCSSEYFALIIK